MKKVQNTVQGIIANYKTSIMAAGIAVSVTLYWLKVIDKEQLETAKDLCIVAGFLNTKDQ